MPDWPLRRTCTQFREKDEFAESGYAFCDTKEKSAAEEASEVVTQGDTAGRGA